MWRMIALLGALGSAISGHAAQNSSQTQPVSVHGTVLNSVTHQPIARALVNATQTAVLTANDGRFEMKLAPGPVQFALTRPGYDTGGGGHVVAVAANMPDLTFSLTPDAVITGHVTLATSDTADGIRIVAYRKRIENGRARWGEQSSATTNSEGAFRLPRIQPGSYLLYTQPAAEHETPPAPGAISYGYAAVYYPGATDIAGAGILTVAAGQHVAADFTLARQPFYPVSIAFANQQGRRRGGLQVFDSSGRPMNFPMRWYPQQGVMQVDMPSGNYFFEEHGGGEDGAYGRTDFTVAGAPVTGLSLAVLPLHPIPVTVQKDFTATNSEGSPTVRSIDSGPGLFLNLVSADTLFDQQRGGGNLEPAKGSSDGSSFELSNVTPGRYWVEATGVEGYISSISSGSVDLARDPLVIGQGNSAAPIEVTLRYDGGAITGKINDPANPPNATSADEQVHAFIYAIPLFPTATHAGQTQSFSSNPFYIGNLAPGSYRVLAFGEQQEIDSHTPAGLVKLTGKGQTVTVEANGTTNVQLDLISISSEELVP